MLGRQGAPQVCSTPTLTLPHAPFLLCQPQEPPEWKEAPVPLDENRGRKAGDFSRLHVGQAVELRREIPGDNSLHQGYPEGVGESEEPDLRGRYPGVTAPSPNLQDKQASCPSGSTLEKEHSQTGEHSRYYARSSKIDTSANLSNWERRCQVILLSP